MSVILGVRSNETRLYGSVWGKLLIQPSPVAGYLGGLACCGTRDIVAGRMAAQHRSAPNPGGRELWWPMLTTTRCGVSRTMPQMTATRTWKRWTVDLSTLAAVLSTCASAWDAVFSNQRYHCKGITDSHPLLLLCRSPSLGLLLLPLLSSKGSPIPPTRSLCA